MNTAYGSDDGPLARAPSLRDGGIEWRLGPGRAAASAAGDGRAPLRVGVLAQHEAQAALLEGLAGTANLLPVPQASLALLEAAARAGQIDAALVDADLPDEGWPLVVAEMVERAIAPFVPILLICHTPGDVTLARVRCSESMAVLDPGERKELLATLLKGLIASRRLAA